jgi:hypothetical protein
MPMLIHRVFLASNSFSKIHRDWNFMPKLVRYPMALTLAVVIRCGMARDDNTLDGHVPGITMAINLLRCSDLTLRSETFQKYHL